ncbi:unnamed protein product [Ectocarpus sp. 8 AP-2014]
MDGLVAAAQQQNHAVASSMTRGVQPSMRKDTVETSVTYPTAHYEGRCLRKDSAARLWLYASWIHHFSRQAMNDPVLGARMLRYGETG